MIKGKDKLKKVFDINEALFAFAYYPWVVSWMFTSTYYKNMLRPYGIIKTWQYVGMFALIIGFLLKDKVNIKRLLLGIVLLLCGFVVSYDNGNASFVFYTGVLIFSARGLDIENIIKITIWCQIVAVSMVVIPSLIGIIPNESFLSESGGVLRLRHNLGYTYTTFAPNFLFSIVIGMFYLKEKDKKGWKLWEIVIIGAINLVLYNYTKTRMSFAMVFIILFIVMIRKIRRNKKKERFKFIYKYSYIYSAIIAIGLSLMYNPGNSWMRKLNELLNQRLRFGQEGIKNWGVSLFGTSVEWNVEAANYNYIDSSYINIMVCYGVIVLLAVIIGMTMVSMMAVRQKNRGLYIALFFWAIRAIVDPQLFLLWFNPFLLFIGADLAKRVNLYKRGRANNAVDSVHIQ